MITSTLGHIQADGHLNNWKLSVSKFCNFLNCRQVYLMQELFLKQYNINFGSHKQMVTWTIKYCWSFSKFQIVKSLFDSRIIWLYGNSVSTFRIFKGAISKMSVSVTVAPRNVYKLSHSHIFCIFLYTTIRINFSKLYCEKLYNKDLLAIYNKN